MTDSCIHLLSMSKVSESVSVVDYLDLLSDISLQESISIYPSYYRSSKKPAAKRKASTVRTQRVLNCVHGISCYYDIYVCS